VRQCRRSVEEDPKGVIEEMLWRSYIDEELERSGSGSGEGERTEEDRLGRRGGSSRRRR
jgi:hypothetical protein